MRDCDEPCTSTVATRRDEWSLFTNRFCWTQTACRSVSCSLSGRRHDCVVAVGRVEQLRLPAAAAASRALSLPRIISVPFSIGLRRRSGQKDVLPIGPGASLLAGRSVTVAPAGPINHGWLSASSCDAAALRTATLLFVY